MRAIPNPAFASAGYTTLLRTIVGQQVSVAAASSIWNKLEAELGTGCAATAVVAAKDGALRSCGLSAQKQGYARSLAELTLSGGLPLDNLPADDEEAIALLTKVKGIGRWSAGDLPAVRRRAPLTSGQRAIWPCRKRSNAYWRCPNAPPKRKSARWPKHGVRTAGPSRS